MKCHLCGATLRRLTVTKKDYETGEEHRVYEFVGATLNGFDGKPHALACPGAWKLIHGGKK